MRKAVPLNSKTQHGFYSSVKPGEPRYLIFPLSEDGPAVALQLDATAKIAAFTALELTSKTIGMAHRHVPIKIEVEEDQGVKPGAIGSAVMSPQGLGFEAMDLERRLLTAWLFAFDPVEDDLPKADKPTWCRWRVVEQLRDGSERILFESHRRRKS